MDVPERRSIPIICRSIRSSVETNVYGHDVTYFGIKLEGYLGILHPDHGVVELDRRIISLQFACRC